MAFPVHLYYMGSEQQLGLFSLIFSHDSRSTTAGIFSYQRVQVSNTQLWSSEVSSIRVLMDVCAYVH
ncbi:unnamed protein product [Urochloa humidicola]